MDINELDFCRPRKKRILASFQKVFSVFTLCYELVKEQRDKESQIHRTVLQQPHPQTAVSLCKGHIFLLIFSLHHSHKKQKDKSGNMGRTGCSTHLCWGPRYTRTHSSLPRIQMYTNQRAWQRGLFKNPYFYLFYQHIVSFFFVKLQKKRKKRKMI